MRTVRVTINLIQIIQSYSTLTVTLTVRGYRLAILSTSQTIIINVKSSRGRDEFSRSVANSIVKLLPNYVVRRLKLRVKDGDRSKRCSVHFDRSNPHHLDLIPSTLDSIPASISDQSRARSSRASRGPRILQIASASWFAFARFPACRSNGIPLV